MRLMMVGGSANDALIKHFGKTVNCKLTFRELLLFCFPIYSFYHILCFTSFEIVASFDETLNELQTWTMTFSEWL